jgi:hypothetical protein
MITSGAKDINAIFSFNTVIVTPSPSLSTENPEAGT